MTDIALIFSDNGFDISLDGTDLRTDSGLRNAVIISFFTDRRAEPDDQLPAGDGDRRGCWMDMFDDHIKGSRLWLLTRELQVDEVMRRAKEYAEEALLWLVEKGPALSVSVEAAWATETKYMLALRVRIELPGDSPFVEEFNYPLRAA